VISREDDVVHHLPAPPPSRLPRASARLTALLGRRSRRGRPLWAALLLACALATVALTAAVGGGALPGLPELPGLNDASSSTAAQQRTEPADRPRATTARPRPTAGSSSAATTVAVPPTTPAETPSPTPSAESPASPPTSTAATPNSTPAPAPDAPAPAPKPAPAPLPAPAVPAAPGPEGEVLALVNTGRAAAGCAPVTADPGLAAVARAHSADMRDRDFFSHDNPDGLDPFQRAAAAGLHARAENIAIGQPDAAAVMADWMSSSGHRDNILDCDLHTLGVGVAQGAGGPWWTQLFD
jgi:uncharacterized protein YkwD